MLKALEFRMYGRCDPLEVCRVVRQARCENLLPLESRRVQIAHDASINALAVDPAESRYLLSGGSDSRIVLYDLQPPTARDQPDPIVPLSTITREQGHERIVTCVEWYPHDTGMFVSGANDSTVVVWDTNTREDRT